MTSKRPRTGRRFAFPRLERVPVGTRDFDPGGTDIGGDDGGAGVREPRRPMPSGPLTDAAELPVPPPPTTIVLPDPRQ
ncbi:hypothetical protein [Actinophytocola xanthii]|uniref:Uncharacterized protein n=1 Tax=Actinophytocola xanthii TaxID=1912961 RepID=A0A1Q8CWN8_9PSEU|nr:hypothetical protein [Actinophytocola xanthii]OLF18758.1 hypothetical protein BU204_04455 [Actinophytocola xanthii]